MSEKTTSGDIIQLNFGGKAFEVVGKDKDDIKRLQQYGFEGAIRLLEIDNILPYAYCQLEDKLLDYEYRKSDIFVIGFPKTGTTWLQEIVWTICHNCDGNSTIQDEVVPFDRMPFFENSGMYNYSHDWNAGLRYRLSEYLHCDSELEYQDMFKLIPDPRLYKCHLTPNLVNPKMLENSKVLYIIRNPIDAFLSYYYYSKTYYSNYFHGDLDEFLNSYINGLVMHGTAATHLKGWWPYRNHKNVHVIFYEDLHKSTLAEIKKIATFLEKDLTDQQIKHVAEKTSFETMKSIISPIENDEGSAPFLDQEQIKKSGGFFREGKIGAAKQKLSKEMYDKLAEYFKREYEGLDLPYEF